jgi:hypothetical protein
LRKDRHCNEPNVVGVGNRIHSTAAFERDIELAREVVEIAVVQNVMVQGVCIRARVEQLLAIDAGGGRSGDVSYIIDSAAL